MSIQLRPAKIRFGTVCALAYVMMAVSIDGVANPKTQEVMIPFETIKFGQSEHLWEETETGRSSFMVKFRRGTYPSHFHGVDYQVVVIKGTVVHRMEGLPESDTTKLVPGSFWYQPAKRLHREICLSDECILFVVTAGKLATFNAPFPR